MTFPDGSRTYSSETIRLYMSAESLNSCEREELESFNRYVEHTFKKIRDIVNIRKCVKLTRFQILQRLFPCENTIKSFLKIDAYQSKFIVDYAYDNGITGWPPLK